MAKVSNCNTCAPAAVIPARAPRRRLVNAKPPGQALDQYLRPTGPRIVAARPTTVAHIAGCRRPGVGRLFVCHKPICGQRPLNALARLRRGEQRHQGHLVLQVRRFPRRLYRNPNAPGADREQAVARISLGEDGSAPRIGPVEA